MVSEQANDIITAVRERKAFIIRTMVAVVIVILIFSLFLNKYILKPIGLLVKFSEGVKKKSNQTINFSERKSKTKTKISVTREGKLRVPQMMKFPLRIPMLV